MNKYTQGIAMGIVVATFLMMVFWSDKRYADQYQDEMSSTHAQTMESLRQSQEHLDSMIAMAEQMHEDLIIINQNSDAIFRSVTGCVSDDHCARMRQALVDAP